MHCHNDLGMAVANSLAGIAGGARQIECTVNGIGERAGNAALEEVVMAINVRNDVFPWWNKIDTTMLTRASKLVSAATSFPVQYNKAIVGRNAFAHESGIHQDGVLKDASTYEIMRPEMIGLKKSSLVLGKHSGRHAFVHKLEEMGYKLGANQLEDAFVRMKALADRKKDIYDEDIEALVDQEIAASHDRIKLASLTVIAGTHGPQRATMKLDVEGQIKIEEAEGNGPVDAVFNCIKALVPHEAKLELYQVHAVTEGTDAQAEVSVRLAHEGRSMTSKASDPDTLVASAKAYLGALNKIVMKHQRDSAGAGGELTRSVIPGWCVSTRPGISDFSDVQLHIGNRFHYVTCNWPSLRAKRSFVGWAKALLAPCPPSISRARFLMVGTLRFAHPTNYGLRRATRKRNFDAQLRQINTTGKSLKTCPVLRAKIFRFPLTQISGITPPSHGG